MQYNYYSIEQGFRGEVEKVIKHFYYFSADVKIMKHMCTVITVLKSIFRHHKSCTVQFVLEKQCLLPWLVGRTNITFLWNPHWLHYRKYITIKVTRGNYSCHFNMQKWSKLFHFGKNIHHL
jgi:hypothetical protein